jgi:YVTN family beta-propeller protein
MWQILDNNRKNFENLLLYLVFVVIFLIPLVVLSNDAFAQTFPNALHNKTLHEVVKQASGLVGNARIDVGNRPSTIDFWQGNVGSLIYVANEDSGTVSVISAENHTKIEDIAVGESPVAIGISLSDTVYVANTGSGTVSVISGENDTKIKDIDVGKGPINIAVDDFYSNTIYVAKEDSGSVYVIDGVDNKMVAGITFKVNPFNSGYILCDGLTTPSPTQQYIYVYSGTQCTAKPNEGFEFVSWEENLEGNSTQLITLSRSASSWDSFVLGIINLFSADKADEPEAKLNVTKFGTFTANFKELLPAVPSEYWIPLYGIIASTIVGWSIPSIIGWTKSRSDVGKLNGYHKQIASLYRDGKLDEKDIGPLDRLTSSILDAYSKGKINERHYESLRSEISILYEKIFRKRIDDLLNTTDDNPVTKIDTRDQLAKIKQDVKYAYSEGKINDKHYDLLNKDILDLDDKNDH